MGIMVSEVYEALIAAGAPEDKAKAAAEAIPVSDVLATREDIAGIKQDIAALRAESQQDIAGLRAATRQDIAGIKQDIVASRAATQQDIAALRAESKQAIAALRAESQQDIAGLRAATRQDIAKLENRLTRLELAVFGGGATGLALLIKLAFFS
jgi:hypothetical protein